MSREGLTINCSMAEVLGCEISLQDILRRLEVNEIADFSHAV